MQGNNTAQNSPYFRVLSPEQVYEIHLVTLEVLERTGVRLEEPQARELLHNAGAHIDKERVRIPSFLVEEAIRTAPKRITLCQRDGLRTVFLEDHKTYFGGTIDCAEVLDPFTRQRTAFTLGHAHMNALVNDYCPHISFTTPWGGHANDVPLEWRDQATFLTVLRHTRKPIGTTAPDARVLADIIEMAAVVAGSYDKLRQNPCIYHYSEPITPLVHFNNAVQKLMLCAERGIPVVYTPMPMAGATAPASAVGPILLGNAETLSGLVIHQLKAKGAPFIYGGMPAAMDMRTSIFPYGAPEFALYSAAMTELALYYRLPMYGTAGCGDAREMDAQMGAELMMTCLMAALSGANLIHNAGKVDHGDLVSPEAIVLTDEILGMVQHIMNGVAVTPQTLALDLIDKVGPGGSYIAEEHTFQNFRQFWAPRFFDKSRYGNWLLGDRTSLAERINRQTREIIEAHTVEPLPDHVEKELAALENKWSGS